MKRFIIILCLFYCPPVFAQDNQLDELKALFSQLNSRVAMLETESEAKDVKIEELENQLEGLRTKGERLNKPNKTELAEHKSESPPSVPKGPAFPEWELDLDPMWMDLKGLDWHAFDVVRYTSVTTTAPSQDLILDYDYNRTSKNLDLNSLPTFRGEFTHRLNSKFRVGVSGWFFDSDDSTSGRVTTSSVDSTETLPDGSTVRRTFKNWVTMWDANIKPVTNELEPNGWSPIDYWAKQKFNIWALDLFATRNLVKSDRGFLDMNIGTKISRPNHETELGQKQYAYLTNYFGWDTYENSITLESTSEAQYSLLTGPIVGFQGRFNIWGPVRFDGFINQAVLLGKVHQRGTFHDVDDIYWRNPGQVVHYLYDGNAPFKSSKSVAIPVTEIKAKLLFDISENVAFNIGGFFSQWWDMPIAPELHAPWDQTISSNRSGLNWQEREKTLRFMGLNCGFTMRF